MDVLSKHATNLELGETAVVTHEVCELELVTTGVCKLELETKQCAGKNSLD